MAVKPEVFEAIKKAVDMLTTQTDSEFSLKKIEGKKWMVYVSGKTCNVRIDMTEDEEEEGDEEG